MRNLLVGNGINIKLGGSDYLNSSIIERMCKGCKSNKYSLLFGNKLSLDEMNQLPKTFYEMFEKTISFEYKPKTEYQEKTIERLKKNYKNIKCINQIGLEDLFFSIEMFYENNLDIFSHKIATINGLSRILLDAIYNDGKIQTLFHNMSNSFKEFINKYDKVFTVNYDCNLDIVYKYKVYHLHGDFDTLHPEFDINTVYGKYQQEYGKYQQEYGKKVEPLDGFRHCYSNALFNFDGFGKIEESKRYQDLENNIDEILKKENEIINYVEISGNKPKEIGSIINLLKLNNNSCKYPFDEFNRIKGELDIIGMSPNNDDHLFKMINDISLDKVTYYFYELKEKHQICSMIPKVYTNSVKELWKSLNM